MGDLCYTGYAAADETSETVMITITEQISTLSLNDSQQSSVAALADEKDPRKIARKYQMDLCKKALDENTIAYLGTGCGKTHIAILLMYEMRGRIKKPEKEICVFLAPTVALVEQQARVIQDSIDLKVGTYCGSSKRLKGHHDWEKELEQFEVLVMTPQILLYNLCHCFIKMDLIALLIFDECHYAQTESNHPYAEIMKVFYKSDVEKLPRVFGMTASPKHGKGASIGSLETLLHAKVYSAEDNEELEQYISSPKVSVYYYPPASNSSLCPHASQLMKLEEIKQQCFSTLSMKTDDHGSIKNTKKELQRLHDNLVFCLENLGLWGALQASQILLKGDNFEQNELNHEAEGQCSDDALRARYLAQVASVFASECMKGGIEADLSRVETLKVPFFSWKLLQLIGILSSFRLQPNMKCIIFVNRIITARSLSYELRQLKILSSWRCGYLVGVHSGLKDMSRKTTNIILEKFRSGELNLLVATKVGEEGLDIQTCCLVIRFDLPETVASFIQSRGRARMPQSEYAFLVDRGNQKELNLIQNFEKDEAKMNDEIVARTSSANTFDFEEKTYKVDSTGATISSGYSISLLHRYCSKLPHDEYFNPKPQFYYFEDTEGTFCHIILPANASLHQIVGAPQTSIESAKKDACLKACKELHEVGALSDILLPGQNNEESGHDFSDSDSDNEEDSRRELHEMLVPAALNESWISMETVYLNSYFIKFSPHPADRVYRNFGLFVKAPIPGEANRMKLDLHLTRGRSVMTELVPSGTAKFVNNEMILAERFQALCLKVILDRSDLTADTVLLGENDFSYSRSSTFYLMLPVILHDGEEKMDVDWKLVRKCLSSPIFRTPGEARDDGACHRNNYLHLANGPKSIDDVVNSLVYAPCKDTFFFVSDIVAENNGYSIYKESTNHVDHYAETFRIHLSYPNQPLLKAKQLFRLDNLLRKKGHSESREKEEHFVELPPEICQMKIIGFSKDIGSSLSLLPSIMHRLESLLVAVELKDRLSASFPEGAEVTAYRVLEALTTEKCNESFSLERLEVLGDAFLKFAVGRRLFLLHDTLDEGQLTGRRSNAVNNSNLFKLAVLRNLHVYVRDRSFEPCQFFALGRRCKVVCTEETKTSIHSSQENNYGSDSNAKIRCSKGHHWLHKKTVADVVEALVGAFIVDSGFKAATAFLKWIGIQVDFKASQVASICSASEIFMPLSAQIEIPALERLLGYQFRHKGLLLQAFVHPSYNSQFGGCYQRLEFLGDAVLDYLITSYLYSVYPNLKPGQLTDLRSVSVSNNSFADIAVKRSFNKFILCDSKSLRYSMDKYANFIRLSASDKGLVEEAPCPKALGDLVESCFGAILLDSGFNLDLVWRIMLSFLDPVMKFSKLPLDSIRELQELCQFHNWVLTFPSVKKDGKFFVEGKVAGEGVSSSASAANVSRKSAKRIAAEQIFLFLKARGYKTKTKSLEEVLRSSQRMEAKLIGYDENPLDITPSLVSQFDNLKLQEPSIGNGFQRVGPETVEATKSTQPRIRPVRQSTSQCESSGRQSKETAENTNCNGYSKTTGGLRKISAKSHLYELCAANCWKPPFFECCQETGPSHLKDRNRFVFKAVVEIEDASKMILESIGDPRAKKKDATEHAAEGALWYLKHIGYLKDTNN